MDYGAVLPPSLMVYFLSFQYQINCNSESLDLGCSLYWPLSLISWGLEGLLEGGQTILLIADRDEAPFEGRVTDKHCFGFK